MVFKLSFDKSYTEKSAHNFHSKFKFAAILSELQSSVYHC